jgi:predicted Rossmann-fold nucleotide-binding protein
VDGFFDPLLSFFSHAVAEGFVSKGNLDNLVVASDAPDLVGRLAGWVPVVKGLVLSAEQRKAAIGEDVAGRAGGEPAPR